MEKDIIIQMKQSMPTFSKSQKKIAQALIDNYQETAYMTASKLGALVGVSESTVVRFAYELGYEGYPELQRAIQKAVCSKMTPNQRIEATEMRFAGGDILKNVMMRDVEMIRYTLENLDRDSFDNTVQSLLKARRAYIIGARSSAALASFFNFNLSLISDHVKLVQPTSTSEVFEQMLDIGSEDVLFCITFPRYSAKILGASNYAKAQGATVIALTDSQEAPISRYASYILTARSDMASFVDTLTAPLSVLNAVLVAIVQGKRNDVKSRFDRLESIWDQYNVYTKQ